MAYSLRIVRTQDWTQAAKAPITKQEVDELVATDAELAWSTTDYVDVADKAGGLSRCYMIEWRGEPCFWWYRDQIQCSGPNEAQVSKLVQISRTLNAQVIGDEGEVYPLEKRTAALAEQLNPPIQRWPLWKQLLVALLLGCVLLILKLLIVGR